jgi:hypothetical protein
MLQVSKRYVASFAEPPITRIVLELQFKELAGKPAKTLILIRAGAGGRTRAAGTGRAGGLSGGTDKLM